VIMMTPKVDPRTERGVRMQALEKCSGKGFDLGLAHLLNLVASKEHLNVLNSMLQQALSFEYVLCNKETDIVWCSQTLETIISPLLTVDRCSDFICKIEIQSLISKQRPLETSDR
jgi:hypothetical protein